MSTLQYRDCDENMTIINNHHELYMMMTMLLLLLMITMLMLMLMLMLTRRPQVESWACVCVVSRGTVKPMVHFKR